MQEITYLSVDTVECDNNNGGCEHNCANTEGSYYCTCREGYRLASNDENCEGIAWLEKNMMMDDAFRYQ